MNQYVYQPLLNEVPTTPSEWWALLRRFVSTWYGVGVARSESNDVARRRLQASSGRPVGSAFGEWASFHDDLVAARIFSRAMRDDYALAWQPVLNSITLLTLAEQDLHWSVDADRVIDDDPPVVTWLLDHEPTPSLWRRFRPWTATTTAFVLTHVLTYLRGSVAGLSTTISSIEEADRALELVTDNRVELEGQVIYEGTDLVGHAGPSPWSPDPDLTLSVEIGDTWAGRVPQGLIELAASGGGMTHGELIPPEA